VKLISLEIERFGARSQLRLDGFSEQLNVVYGPNGSGKTTLISFLGWMLFGESDDSSRRYLPSSAVRLGGTISLLDGQRRRRRVERYREGLGGDQVRVINDQPGERQPIDPHRLTGVNVDEFHHVFCFGFDQPPSLDRLIDLTMGRDLALAHDAVQLQRVRELTARLDELRRTDPAWLGDESLVAIQQRRARLQADLQAAERRYQERLRQLQQECDEVSAEIAVDRRHLESLQAMLRRTEAALENRRAQLGHLAEQAQQTRQRWLDERRQEVDEIDALLHQWHQLLDSVRQRQERLDTQWAQAQPQTALSNSATGAELRLFLRSLTGQVEDLDEDFREWEGVDSAIEPRGQREYWRNVLGAALHSVHDDVQRLCRELQRQQTNAHYHDHAREQDHLRRCESELNSLIDLLNKRRQSLLAAPEFSEPIWTVPSYRATPLNGTSVARPWSDDVSGDAYEGRSVSYAGPLTDPAIDARLAHLYRRRDHLADRIRELEARIDRHHHRQTQLQASQPQLDETRHLQSLRRQWDETEQGLAQAEQRQRRRDEVAALERQLAELRRTLGPSHVLRQATSLLHRMTDGACRAVRIGERHEVWIEDHHGHSLAYRELSRGTRDQVYLSLALAIAAAYRSRGIELPLVLNDVFINIDADRAQATADVLADFASQGHQLILFTRHEHLMQRFASLRAKLYTLRERHTVDEPLGPPVTAVAEPHWHAPPWHSETHYLDQAPVVPPRGASELPRALDRSEPLRRERPYDWVAHWDPPHRTGAARVDIAPLETAPPLLNEDALLWDVDWLDREHVGRLQQQGVDTVRQFLELAPEQGQQLLADNSVPAATIYRWQSELSLQCYVGLAASDAALLVACGVNDPEELSYIDVSQLHQRIEQLLASADARQRYGSIARFERSRLSRWIQAARRSHFRRPDWTRTRSTRPAPRSQTGNHRGQSTPPLVPRARRVEPQRGARLAEATALQEAEQDDRAETLRFFLEPSDPIVDAPSIGPKTAERLHAIGVTTVAELLELDPTDAAARINYNRINAELIRTWQRQTSLVCRVPNLRGHDAQLLVACNVPTPEALAKLDAAALLAQIEQLLETAEGKRILRGAKAPDQQEVSAWIRWAKHAR
jgi:energy-coupling factor transporter ATP-binding protein EcfA2/predicted flap endonuclease-1-like 5' DNA nuclease